MRHNYIFILLFFIACSACENSSTSINSFDLIEKIVDYDSIYSDKSEPMGIITDIEIADNTLITKHMDDKYSFSFIDVNRKELLHRWGIQGEGPNEYIQLGLGFTISESQIVFLDEAKKEINYISISDILNKNDNLNIARESYPYTVDFRPQRLNIINDKKVVVGSFKEGRFGILDSKNTIVSYPSSYPFDYDEIKGIYRGSVFQTNIKSNSKQCKFVVSTLASDIFEIYQISDSGISKTYISSFNHIPQIWKKGDRYTVDGEKSIAGLMKAAVSEDLICFTYSSQSYNEASRSDKVSNEILCFNWNGEKIKKYILPFSISHFCIDKNYIYGVRYNYDETIFYRFKL